ISQACTNFGFFAITNHGVDPSIIEAAWESSRDFFDCDPSVKSSVPVRDDYPYGYEHRESLGTELSLLPDSKETFSIGPSDSTKSGMPPRQFPSSAPASFAPALSQYFSTMEGLARVLFRGLALALRLDDPSWFLRDECFDDGHQCALRILNYPELEYGEDDANQVRIRAGAHTDYGAMTILKSGGAGLQLQLSPGKAEGEGGDWIDVPHLEDAFVINLGDLMQIWTNDRWRSTLHRVTFKSCRRQSIAFFVNMNGNATVVPFDSCVDDEHPAKYGAIKASEHLLQRHAQSMTGKSSK
ncbi:predicted protein, partial [Thalassiosira pseudonana CCMP1335]